MKYRVAYSTKAVRQLRKLDPPIAALIYGWIDRNLVGTEDPRQRGKAPKGDDERVWRYRVSDYRILAEIDDGVVTIVILTVGKRGDVYRKR